MKVKCPTCDSEVEWTKEATYRPFCSERCRLLDLGMWLDEKHGIEIVDYDDMEDEDGNAGGS